MLRQINKAFERTWFTVAFKIITLIAFIGLIIIGFAGRSEFTVLSSQLYRTNLTSVFVWDTWWPLIIMSAIFFGRVWCMICPVEMITSFCSRVGFRLKRPGWITSGWVITVFYAVIVILGITIIEIDLNPVDTAWYLLIIVMISIFAGVLFEKNTFCKYICPVGYLLGIYSKFSFIGLRVKSKNLCRGCVDKSCISSKYLYQQNYKSCGVDLIPAEISDNSQCILCGGCIKTCKTYKTVSNTIRPNPALVKIGFANDFLQVKPLLFAEWIFLYFLSAHLIEEITEFQFITDLNSRLFNQTISGYLAIQEGNLTIIASTIFLFLILSFMLWFLPYLLIRSGKIKLQFNEYLKNFSSAFIPVIAGLFVGLIIWEIVSRIPYYKYVASNPAGIKTIQGILTKQIAIFKMPVWTDWIFLTILLVSLAAGIYLSFAYIRKFTVKYLMPDRALSLFGSVLVFVLLFFASVLLYHNF